MKIVARCPKCDARLPVGADDASSSIKCGGCSHELSLSFSDALRRDAKVDACPVCCGSDFYFRKDFDPNVGLAVVIIGALTSAVFYWFGRDLVAYSILAFAVVVDLIVYGRLRNVTVCYRCHSEFRGKYQRTAPPFDLHIADLLEPGYERRIGRR